MTVVHSANPSREVLELAYKDLVSERDRLRDARAGFTKLLGPLPASAGIAIGLVGSAGSKVGRGWLIEAGGLLLALIAVGITFGGLRPYRLLRADHDPAVTEGEDSSRMLAFRLDETDPETWLRKRIKVDEDVCGNLRRHQRFRLARKASNLQDALDVERSAALVVQTLFGATIGVLVTALAVRGSSQNLWWLGLLVGGGPVLGIIAGLAWGHFRQRGERVIRPGGGR